MAKGYFPDPVMGERISLTFVCFDCREVAKGGSWRKCPKCRKDMSCVGMTFKAPKRADDRAWKLARQEHSGNVSAQDRLTEVKDWLKMVRQSRTRGETR